MIEQSISKRYARALLTVANDEALARVDEYGAQLKLFADACTASEVLLETLSNRYFDLFARQRIVDALANKLGLATAVKNFIKLLIQKGRIGLFQFVVAEYKTLADAIMGREIMTVVSAVGLPEAQYDAIGEVFGKMTGKKMLIERKTLPEVLGGVRVHINDRVYDYTVKNQLEQMKHRMLG